MKLIGQGMTAKIYEHSAHSIAKVFNRDIPLDYIQYESDLLSAISQLDIKTAKFIGFQSLEDQHAIIMEKIDGNSFFTEVLGNPFNILKYIDQFIETQGRINSQSTKRLPSEKARFTAQVLRSGLETSTLERIRLLINELPEMENVCHGDFHFGNLISSGDGLIAIDWMNTYRGNPLGDVLRSYLMLKSPFNPLPIKGLKKFAFMSFKSFVAEIYMQKAMKKKAITRRERGTWLAIISAVRLSDNVPDERQWLQRIIDKNIQLTSIST